MVLIDLTGKQYGKLTVLYRGPDKIRPSGVAVPRWYCRCSCGNPNPSLIEGGDLRRKDANHTVSCGCGGDGIAGSKNKTHGLSTTGAYSSFIDMHSRCTNIKNKEFINYGARGITVCDRWAKTEEGVINFMADMGERPLGGSLERLDVNKGYHPDNCVWIPMSNQARNTRFTRLLEFRENQVPMSDVARALFVSPSYIAYYLSRGKTVCWIEEHVKKQRALGNMSISQEGWKHG